MRRVRQAKRYSPESAIDHDSNGEPEQSEFERFEDLARKLVRVAKVEVDAIRRRDRQ